MKTVWVVYEQRMREQFEKWAKQVLGFEIGDFDREEAGSRFGDYTELTTEFAWQAYRARDAEVQKLRQALGELLVATDQISEFDNDTNLIAAADKALGWEVVDE